MSAAVNEGNLPHHFRSSPESDQSRAALQQVATGQHLT
jgi:hypothetical protein